jgi:type I restriction enzyme S subunit
MIVKKWNDSKLGELGEFSNGVNFTRDQMGQSSSRSLKLINVKDLYNDGPYLDFSNLDHITLKSLEKFRGYLVKKDDIFFARSSVKRDGVGVVELAKEDNDECVHCGFVIRFRSSSPKIDKLYLTYLLRSPFYRQAIINLSSGATITNIAQGNLRNLPIIYPPLPTQQKIADVLSAYDDLIENNNKRIALLEKAAEEIYREWFVRMRFPGWQNVRFVKGVPAGWERLAVSMMSNEIRGITKIKNISPTTKYLGLEHLPRKSIAITSFDRVESVQSDKLLFKERDILFGKIRPYLHKVALAHFSGVCSSDTIIVRPKKLEFEGYLLFTLFSETFIELATISSKGTKMPRADWDFLKKLEILCPPESILQEFQKQFDSMFNSICSYLRQK